MSAVEAKIGTDRSGRFLKQLRDHATAMSNNDSGHRPPHSENHPDAGRPELQVEAGENRVVLSFGPLGRCIATADRDALNIRIEAGTADDLERIQQIISRDLQRFGQRDGLTVTWRPVTTAGS
jgi:hypothetical protein